MDCVFCKISSGEESADKILETSDVVAFHSISPEAEVHAVIVPKKHVEGFEALDEGELLDKMRVAAQQIIRDFKLEGGYKLIFNGGRFRHVPHLHWNLLGGGLKRS